jgi:hypothetical protein
VPLTAEQVIEFLDSRLGSYARLDVASVSANPMLARRAWQVQRIRSYLQRSGFPATGHERCELSLIPHIFQEANYDGFDWGRKDADLGHLSDLFALDFYVATGGVARAGADESLFRQYDNEVSRCIDVWTRKPGRP